MVLKTTSKYSVEVKVVGTVVEVTVVEVVTVAVGGKVQQPSPESNV